MDTKDLQKYKTLKTKNKVTFESLLEPSIVRIEDQKKYIVMCHEESTFRSGESPPSRWVWNNDYTFFNKGYG